MSVGIPAVGAGAADTDAARQGAAVLPAAHSQNQPAGVDEVLISQGAEALVYRSELRGRICVRKHRPAKSYRLPVLDRRLTKQRITAEARLLQQCREAGIDVPELYRTEPRNGDLWMELVLGSSVKDVLRTIERNTNTGIGNPKVEGQAIDSAAVMRSIGVTVARLHISGLVHGDLTTSNLLLRDASTGPDPGPGSGSGSGERSVCMIDFGLGNRVKYPHSGEERAVDLYVLERAFLSTHPGAADLFGIVLDSYRSQFEESGEQKLINAIMKRLEIVRMRGRKRSMVG